MPERVQIRRVKGWKRPPNTVWVARPGRWGNPFPVGRTVSYPGYENTTAKDAAHAVELYRQLVGESEVFRVEVRVELAGKNLACWCPPGTPCHADVLLEIANPEVSR